MLLYNAVVIKIEFPYSEEVLYSCNIMIFCNFSYYVSTLKSGPVTYVPWPYRRYRSNDAAALLQ